MNKKVETAYVWTIAGRQRMLILKALDKPLTAALIKKRTNIKITNISDVLREMVRLKLAVVLNPRDGRNRVYALTKIGQSVRSEVLEL